MGHMVNLPGKNDTVHEKGLNAIQIWSSFYTVL